MPWPPETLVIGDAAPVAVVRDGDGVLHRLGEQDGGAPTLLIFFKIACPTCQFALPFWERWWRRLPCSQGTLWMISQDPPDHTAMFNREFGLRLPNLFDEEEAGYPASEAYRVIYVPSVYLVRGDRTIDAATVGFNRREMEEIAERWAALAASPAVPMFDVTDTVPLVQPGCSGKN